MKPRIVIITTGGTIAMRYDPQKGGAVPAVGGASLVQSAAGLEDLCTLEVREFANISSYQFTPALMFQLALMVKDVLEQTDTAGVVITHGTDTVEETAFFLDLLISSPKPLCFTAAMRNNSDPNPDGPYNLLCAVRTALSEKSRNQGPLLVVNGEIHAARFVTKIHTSALAAFASPTAGPLGYVDDDGVHQNYRVGRKTTLMPKESGKIVPIIKSYTGAGSNLIQAALACGIDGLVVEGYGRGNVAPELVPGIEAVLAKGLPVVIATRVQAGRCLGAYAAEGGGERLRQAGAILSGVLSSQKARLLLMLGLSCGLKNQELAACIENY